MPSNPPIPDALDEVVGDIALILAQGYLRHRKRRQVSPESGGEARYPIIINRLWRNDLIVRATEAFSHDTS